MKDLKVEYINIKDIKPYEKNAKLHPKEQIEQIKRSIQDYGMNDPIAICGDDNTIVEGHGRWLALKELGEETIPVIRLDHLSKTKMQEYLLVHNKLTMNTGFDIDILNAELDAIVLDDPLADMSFYDFDIEEPKIEIKNEEDEAPEVDEYSEPLTKTGDVWLMGKHRLICGDSTRFDDVEKLMDGEIADMVFTDPPYGMKKESDGVMNDNLNYDELLTFNKEWIKLSFDFLKDTGCWYCFGNDEPLMDIYSEILKPLKKENKICIRNYITWAKHSAFGVNSSEMLSYPNETEKCWFIMKGQDWNNNNMEFFNTKFERILTYLQTEAEKVKMRPSDVKKICGVSMYSHWFSKSQFIIIPAVHYARLQEAYPDNFKLEYNELRALLGESNDPTASLKPYFDNKAEEDVGGIGLTNVWRFPVTSIKEREETGGHATPKPLALCRRGIKASSRIDEIVLDFFGGSGSTLIACEQLNRQCRMIELDPRYCDVIVKRWENMTGQKAVKMDL